MDLGTRGAAVAAGMAGGGAGALQLMTSVLYRESRLPFRVFRGYHQSRSWQCNLAHTVRSKIRRVNRGPPIVT